MHLREPEQWQKPIEPSTKQRRSDMDFGEYMSFFNKILTFEKDSLSNICRYHRFIVLNLYTKISHLTGLFPTCSGMFGAFYRVCLEVFNDFYRFTPSDCWPSFPCDFTIGNTGWSIGIQKKMAQNGWSSSNLISKNRYPLIFGYRMI